MVSRIVAWGIAISVVVFILIPSIVLLSVSFSSLESTEYGLNYNGNVKSIENLTYTSGLYFLGVGHSFIVFPKTLQTIDFTTDTTPLSALTSDGLPVTLEISFQYQLNQDQIYELYLDLGDTWPEVFSAVGQHILAAVASDFPANDFFSNQVGIGNEMKSRLNDEFTSTFYSSVDQFQLKSVSLPDEFEGAIEDTIVASQSIQKAQYLLDTAQVDAKTVTIQTSYNANITIVTAQAVATNTLSLAIAQANADYNLIVIEASSLKNCKGCTWFK